MNALPRIAVFLVFLIIISAGVAMLTTGKAPITGGMTMVKDFFKAMPPAYTYFLLALFVVGIIFNVGYTRLASAPEAQMKRLMGEAKKQIKKGAHEKALKLYEDARLLYSRLGSVDKIRHYDEIMNIYEELRTYSRAGEAKELAEKYVSGEITKDELQRFEMILRGY